MILGIAVGAALLVGFLIGLLCFKKTNEYCGRCGVTRECPVCSSAAQCEDQVHYQGGPAGLVPSA
jgi:hypothetical protein